MRPLLSGGGRLALPLAVVLATLLCGCAVNPVTGRTELAIKSFTPEEEAALGAQAYGPAVQQQGGYFRDATLEAYVQEVGMRVARVSHRPELGYRFRVLNSSVPNAFALPGGFIVINRGLLTGLRNEGEMAAVLAHETGHVTARHSLAGYQRAMAENLLLQGLAAGLGGKSAAMKVSQVTTSLVENGFSRDQEREADWLGIDYMVKGGYDPVGAVQLQEYFFKEMEGGKNPMMVEGLFRTHPFSKERLDNARQRIKERYPGISGNPAYTLNEAAYRKNMARLREVQKAYDLYDEGDKLFQKKDYDGALAKYEAAAAKEPGQAPFHSAIGRVHMAKKNWAEADKMLRKAVSLDGELFEPHFLLGASAYTQKAWRQAIPELSRSMDLLPSKQAAGMLSKSYEAVGEAANARKYAEMAQ